MSSLKETNKDLYGTLMLENQRLENVGTSLIWIVGVIVLASCVTIHMRWIDSLMGVPIDKLRGFGVYTLAFLVVFLIYVIITNIRENLIYKSIKPQIFQKLQENKISIEELLAEIAEDEALENIKEKIMDDKSIQHKQSIS